MSDVRFELKAVGSVISDQEGFALQIDEPFRAACADWPQWYEDSATFDWASVFVNAQQGRSGLTRPRMPTGLCRGDHHPDAWTGHARPLHGCAFWLSAFL